MSSGEAHLRINESSEWSKQEKFVLDKLETISEDIKSMSHEVQEIKLQMATNGDQQKRIELLEKEVSELRTLVQRIMIIGSITMGIIIFFKEAILKFFHIG